MPPLARLGDKCSGHGCFPPRPLITSSGTCFVNGIAVCRVGDRLDTHTCVTSHDGTVIGGSGTTFINGMAAARIGDPIDCGSTILEGSSTSISEA